MVASPKECFRELKRLQLVSNEQTECLLKMVDDRNATTHTYDEHFINSLTPKLSEYAEAMRTVLGILSIE